MSPGDRVRIVQGERAGRVGVVKRVPKLFPEWVYVTLDKAPRERTIKTIFEQRAYMAPEQPTATPEAP